MGSGTGLTAVENSREALRERIRLIGREVLPETIKASNAVLAPLHETEPYESVNVQRDIPYGRHDRNRLDVFVPEGINPDSSLHVMVFVHGGAFVAGDKRREGSPYHDNVGLWAARSGMVGITINHRLAPDSRWPAGAEDIAAVVDWIGDQDFGGLRDQTLIHLMGSSSGAVHVATYITGTQFHGKQGHGVASASLVSGVYDLSRFDAERLAPYFDLDENGKVGPDLLEALVTVEIPVLYAVAEFDPVDAQKQFLILAEAHLEANGTLPQLLYSRNCNHFTITGQLNTRVDDLGPGVLALIGGTRGSDSTHDVS